MILLARLEVRFPCTDFSGWRKWETPSARGEKKRWLFSTQGKLEKQAVEDLREQTTFMTEHFLGHRDSQIFNCSGCIGSFLLPKSICNTRLQQQNSIALTLGNSDLYWQNCKAAQQGFMDWFLRVAVNYLEDSLSRYAIYPGAALTLEMPAVLPGQDSIAGSALPLLHCSWGLSQELISWLPLDCTFMACVCQSWCAGYQLGLGYCPMGESRSVAELPCQSITGGRCWSTAVFPHGLLGIRTFCNTGCTATSVSWREQGLICSREHNVWPHKQQWQWCSCSPWP